MAWLQGGGKTLPGAGNIGAATCGDKDGREVRRVSGGERLGFAHLLQSLRGVRDAHEELAIGARAPQLEPQLTAGRRVVNAAVENPVDAERAGDGDDVGVVADKDDEAVAHVADSARNGLAGYVLLHGFEDVIEEIRCRCARDDRSAKAEVPTCGVELHEVAQGRAIEASPAGVGVAHALGVLEQQILSHRAPVTSGPRAATGGSPPPGFRLEGMSKIEMRFGLSGP